MKRIILIFFIVIGAPAMAKNCGSITKNGVEHSISCDIVKAKTTTPTHSRCRASITFNGKTQNFNHHCMQKSAKTVPNTVIEPAGNFMIRQRLHKSVINELAEKYDMEAALVHAVISVESAYRVDVVSDKGAVGLMQLMPSTALLLNVEDSFDATANIDGGIRYLKAQLKRFNNKIDLALAAYNAGPNAVIKYHNTIPPYRETRQYVQRVKKYREHYRGDWKKYIQ